jgi:hypothetical protein
MQAVRFELTKQIAQDLKPCPFDRSGTLAFDITVVHMGTRTPSLKVRSLTRYPIALYRQILNKYTYIILSYKKNKNKIE